MERVRGRRVLHQGCGPLRPRRGTATIWGWNADEHGLWHQEPGPTVFAALGSGTDYFGSRGQQTMLNFRVRDLDAMLAQLRAAGAEVADGTQDLDGVGRFGWVTDPEGNRIDSGRPRDAGPAPLLTCGRRSRHHHRRREPTRTRSPARPPARNRPDRPFGVPRGPPARSPGVPTDPRPPGWS